MMDLVDGVGGGKGRKRRKWAVRVEVVWVEWSGWCGGDGLGQVAKQLWRSAPDLRFEVRQEVVDIKCR